jgi:HEAT repeat protein
VRLGSALGVRTSERRTVALVATLMFVSLAGSAIGESAVNALFFDRIGTQALPLMYLAQAGTTLVAMFALTAVLQRVAHRSIYIWSPLLMAVVVLAERGVLLTDARWIYPVLWVTVAFATLAQAIGLWGTAGTVVDARQAKRLFPIFGAGGILGAVAGGLLTRPLAAVLGVDNLLLVWIGGLIVAAGLCRLCLGGAGLHRAPAGRQTSLLQGIKSGYAYVRRSRLLAGMAVAAVLFSVLFYSLFLPFATAATDRFSDTDALAGFFGLVGASITGGAFLMSVLLTNRLFARFGVTAMMLVLPLLYLGAFGILLVGAGFATIVVLKVTTGVWLQGVASPAWETLVNVVPDDRRDETRAFLNGGPAQVGTAIAGLVALVGQDVLTAREFAAIGIVASLLTVAVVLVIRRSYVDALLRALLAARPQVFEKATAWTPAPLDVDAQSARVLADSMRSDDVHARRFAFQMAAGLHAHALAGALAEGLHDTDPLVRLAAVAAIDTSTPSGREALLGLIDDADTAVSAAASAGALSFDDRAAARLDRLLGDEDAGVRLVALVELDAAPTELAADLAERSLADRDPLVQAAALDLLVSSAPDRALAAAVSRIDASDPVVRLAAGRALGVIGSPAIDHVLAALRDPETVAVGIEAARRMEPDGASEEVQTFVRSAADRARNDRALVASTPQDPELEALLRTAILARARVGARSALWAATMVAADREAARTAIERIDGSGSVRASALETLEAADATKSVGPLLALWEPIQTTNDDGSWLTSALEDEDDLVRRCAEVIRSRREGDTMVLSTTTVSVVERVLILRRIPLFVDLSPADLERLALIAEEQGYDDGETIAREGELGDAMHIVTEGVIRVVSAADGDERVLALRTAGEVVGEMSIITRNPRIASLIADGPVRTIRIGQREFESMVRERPDLALGVMRVLALRLAESARTTAPDAHGS